MSCSFCLFSSPSEYKNDTHIYIYMCVCIIINKCTFTKCMFEQSVGLKQKPVWVSWYTANSVFSEVMTMCGFMSSDVGLTSSLKTRHTFLQQNQNNPAQGKKKNYYCHKVSLSLLLLTRELYSSTFTTESYVLLFTGESHSSLYATRSTRESCSSRSQGNNTFPVYCSLFTKKSQFPLYNYKGIKQFLFARE